MDVHASYRSSRWERKGKSLRQNGGDGRYPTGNGLIDTQAYKVRVFSERAFESLESGGEGGRVAVRLG